MSASATQASLNDWIADLFEHRALLQMGHGQRLADQNLGLGWMYYALARVVRPAQAAVIGSYRGFVPLVIARALADNSEGGRLHFIDPSLVDDFWKNDAQAKEYFASLGISNITHHLMTTQEFATSDTYRQLDELGIVFIDGYHSAEQAEFDFEAFAPKLAAQGVVLLHDSVWALQSRMYGPGREYVHSVLDFVSKLKQLPEWQVFDMPFGDGVSLVRKNSVPQRSERVRGAHSTSGGLTGKLP